MTATNGVRPFDPNEHMTDLRGKSYLEVRFRLVWFRQEHPDGSIVTDLIEHDRANQYAVVKATVTVPGGGAATGYSLTEPTTIAKDYIANAETSAIGRALAHLGYGTVNALEMEQGDTLADSPVEKKAPAKPQPATQRPLQKPLQPEPAIGRDGEAGLTKWLAEHSVEIKYARDVARQVFKRSGLYALTAPESKRLRAALTGDLVRADSSGAWVIVEPPVAVAAGE